jgi:hypothetical protein
MLKFLLFILIFFLSSCGGESQEFISTNKNDDLRLTELKILPNHKSSNAIRLYPTLLSNSNWQVFRAWPNGEIRIFLLKNSELIEVSFLPGASVLAKLTLESSGDLYLFTYDVESNTPSGRGLKGVSEGIDLWHFSYKSAQVSKIASGLPLGGVDNVLYSRIIENKVDVCTLNKCIRVSTNGAFESWSYGLTPGYEIIEIHFSEEKAYALIRRLADHVTGNFDYSLPPYKVVSLAYPGSSGESSAYTVDHDCLPFRLRWENRMPNWSCAKTASELAEVLRSDIDRTPHSGLGDIGLNNSEGRIAWGLVYSLNALLHLHSNYAPKLASASNWINEKLMLRDALELIARQGIDTNLGYSSRRYSQNRTPILYALHLGRISQLLSKSVLLGYSSDSINKALKVVLNDMHTLDRTAETRINLGSYKTLAFKKGIDFWADGSNVPYNYISGYVHGFLTAVENPEDHALEMKNLLLPLIENEILSNSNQWQYWWGYGNSGWSKQDSISLNTPDYNGSIGIAHISYRSMDAMALLRLAKVNPIAVETQVLIKIRNLVSTGLLLPFVNQELVEVGGLENINPRVALYYSRSASPSELHAQLFALESLVDK